MEFPDRVKYCLRCYRYIVRQTTINHCPHRTFVLVRGGGWRDTDDKYTIKTKNNGGAWVA